MTNKKLKNFFSFLLILFLLATLLPPNLIFASTTEGTIDATYKYAWCENFGWINFGTDNSNITVTDSGLTGYAWGENIGWINLNPATSGVKNTDAGVLSGYAWGENVGWINFTGVTIDSDGYFQGYASGDLTGSISFNCANNTSCVSSDFKVRTDWRPKTARGGGGVAGGGSSSFASAGTSLSEGLKVLINYGAKNTNSREILLELEGGANSKKMAISEDDPNFKNANQELYVKNKKWTLKAGDGVKTIFVRFYDAFGNASFVVSDSITLDTTSPINLKIISPQENQILSDNTPSLSGEAEAGTKILISLGVADKNVPEKSFEALMFFQTLADGKGKWQYEIPAPLKDGFYIISVSSEDEAGNISDALKRSFSVKTSPEVIIKPPKTEQPTKEKEIPYFPVLPIISEPPEESKSIPTSTPTTEETPKIITPTEELPKEETPLIKPEAAQTKPTPSPVINELKKVWQEAKQNIQKTVDFKLNLKELVRRPISLVKENSKSLFNTGKYLVIGFSKSTTALARGTTKKVGSIFGEATLKTSALSYRAAKKVISLSSKVGAGAKKTFVAINSIFSKTATGTKKTLVAIGSIFKKSDKIKIASEVLVRIPSAPLNNIEAGKLLFTSKFGNIKIKPLEKNNVTLIASSQFKTFFKPNKPVKAIRAQLIFAGTISRGDDNDVIMPRPSVALAKEGAKNPEEIARGKVMPNLFRHLPSNNMKILKRLQILKQVQDDIYHVALALDKFETIGEKVAMTTLNLIKKIIPTASAQSAAEELIVGEYIYADFNKDGIYEADVRLPDQAGKYYLKNIVDYKDNDKKILETEILVKPSGYIYTPDPRGEIRLEGATITLYRFNKAANKFELFPAAVYNQINPQITDKTGKYSYLAPAGKYYLIVDKIGYRSYTSKEFEIAEGEQISQVIELKVK